MENASTLEPYLLCHGLKDEFESMKKETCLHVVLYVKDKGGLSEVGLHHLPWCLQPNSGV